MKVIVISYSRGHKTWYDFETEKWRYYYNNTEANNKQACVRCGKLATDDEHDFCIANLGRVINACCGHGKGEGYIQFDNGVTIRGVFNIEKDKKRCNVEYEIRSRSEILDMIQELKNNPFRYDELKTLKWVMKME